MCYFCDKATRPAHDKDKDECRLHLSEADTLSIDEKLCERHEDGNVSYVPRAMSYEGFFINDKGQLDCLAEGGCCRIGALNINYCPICRKKLR